MKGQGQSQQPDIADGALPELPVTSKQSLALGNADIKPTSKASLDEMAKLLMTNAGLKVYIVGHTDNVGGLAANLELSQHRAEAVARALVSTYKIDSTRLVARGVASLAPVASNTAEAGQARNRRVELVVQ